MVEHLNYAQLVIGPAGSGKVMLIINFYLKTINFFYLFSLHIARISRSMQLQIKEILK